MTSVALDQLAKNYDQTSPEPAAEKIDSEMDPVLRQKTLMLGEDVLETEEEESPPKSESSKVKDPVNEDKPQNTEVIATSTKAMATEVPPDSPPKPPSPTPPADASVTVEKACVGKHPFKSVNCFTRSQLINI